MPIPLNKKVNDYDSTLAGRLIRYVENPDSIGFINGLWYSPKYDSRFKPGLFDPNNFGMGVDRLKNEYVGNDEFKFHKDSQGKEYITTEEERNLRNHSIANAEDSYNNRLAFAQKTIGSDVTPSEMKKAITMSAIYNLGAGTVSNELFEDKALMDSLLNGSDIGYSNEVNKYFKAHNKGERGPKTNEFINNQSTGVNSSQTPAPIKSPFFSSLTEKLHNAIPHGAYGRWSEGGSLNSPWDGLSLQEKAEMMKVAVRNGIYNLNEIKQKYNEFAEGGKLSEDKEFNEWRESLPDNLRLTDEKLYDLEGAYRAGMQPTLEDDGYYHLGSRDPQTGRILKTPMHPTYWQAIAEDARLGYYPTIRNGETYTINEFKNGGGIHIKPENRGKFTALKKRTGHSATWFKEHGTPAQKKMATFALNARHWKHALGGNLYGTGGSWKQQHEQRWHDFLLGKGLAEADASRLAGFFTAQDGLESAGGKSSAARQKNNYGGMQKNGKNITYDSVNAYMEDKWRMMNSRFKPALSAQSIDEYATILGNPETAGKGYLYYVTDKAKYDPKSPTWKAAQTQHMHNYINGMRAWAGKGKVKFNDPVVPKPQVVEEVPYSTYVASAPTAMPQFIPYNPEVFFGNVQPATPEPVFPIAEPVQETPVIDYEKQDRMDGIRRLGMVMGLLNNTQSTNPFDILTANYFDGTSQPTQQMNIMAYHPDEDYWVSPATRLSEVTVTGKAPSWFGKKGLYPTRYRYNPKKTVASRTGQLTAGDAMKGIDAATGPLLHWAQPSQYVGAVRDAANGKNPLTSMLRGNSGVMSENYASEHPIISTLLNLSTDLAIPAGVAGRNYYLDHSLGNAVVPEGFSKSAPKIINAERVAVPEAPAISWADAVNPTATAAERGRKLLVDWYNSPFYKKRWQKAAPYENTDAIVEDLSSLVKEVPFDYRFTRASLSPSGTTTGTTSPRSSITYTAPDGREVKNFNTGLDVSIASDLGKHAENTGLHELLHYTTANSHGIPQYGKPIYNGIFDPVEIDWRPVLNKSTIIRGKRYQHFMMDQNEGLLPKRDEIYKMVMENPEEAERLYISTGISPGEAKSKIQGLQEYVKNQYDIQENRAYLQEFFIKEVLPSLRNPNDASEIERFLLMHPEKLDNYTNVKKIMEEIRPGSVKQYAKYFAEALSTLPFINRLNKE